MADGQVIRAFAHDLSAPIVFAGRKLCAAANFRADGCHAGNFRLNRQRVLNRQGARAAEAGEHAAAVDAARKNLDDVQAEGGDARLHLRLGAVADADHRDHRANANDDAEHGERGPQLVSAQGAEGDLDGGPDSHSLNCTAFCSWRNRLNSLSAKSRFATAVSPTPLPSRITTMRFVYCAMSSSWVTMTIVIPWSLSF